MTQTAARGGSLFRIVLLAAAMLLTGCVISPSDLISRREPLLDTNTGFVVMSVGHDSSVSFPTVRIPVTPLNVDAQEAFEIRTLANLQAHGAWNIEGAVRATSTGGKRVLLGYSVKPGAYEFSEVNVLIRGQYGTYTAKVPLRRPYKFQVVAGEVTYLGTMEASITRAGNLIGELIPFLSTQVPSTVRLTFFNEEAADREVLLRLRPELARAPLTIANDSPARRPGGLAESEGARALSIPKIDSTSALSARRTGKDTYSAEKLARTDSCPMPQAALVEKGPGFEVHQVLCPESQARTIKCQFGACSFVQ